MAGMSVNDLLEEARSEIERLTPLEAAREVAGGGIIVDTRCMEDRTADGAVPGSVHIPRTVLEWRADPGSEHRDDRIADRDARLIIMCNDGYSSSLAAANLRRMGFARVADVIGGFRGWVASGLPTEAVE
ncbi:MAG TPA: rhodanese-like domain-containing protein [Acidimicrobiia bacterium]